MQLISIELTHFAIWGGPIQFENDVLNGAFCVANQRVQREKRIKTTRRFKSKAFEMVAPGLKVDQDGVANWNGYRLVALPGGEGCTAPTLRDANVA